MDIKEQRLSFIVNEIITNGQVDIKSIAKKLKAFAINPNYKDLNKKNIKIVHNNDFKIYTWTVNNKRDISKMKSLKVDGIITDFPDRF